METESAVESLIKGLLGRRNEYQHNLHFAGMNTIILQNNYVSRLGVERTRYQATILHFYAEIGDLNKEIKELRKEESKIKEILEDKVNTIKRLREEITKMEGIISLLEYEVKKTEFLRKLKFVYSKSFVDQEYPYQEALRKITEEGKAITL